MKINWSLREYELETNTNNEQMQMTGLRRTTSSSLNNWKVAKLQYKN